jgi:hypothetical protein
LGFCEQSEGGIQMKRLILQDYFASLYWIGLQFCGLSDWLENIGYRLINHADDRRDDLDLWDWED